MKLPLSLALLFALPLALLAQQKPHYSQYMMNNYLLNPAISGIEDYADIKLGHRNQWTGIEGAPNTFYLSGHSRLGKSANLPTPGKARSKPGSFAAPARRTPYRKGKAHHGVGGVLLHDQIGPFVRTDMSASYAYHLMLTRTVKLAGGASAGIISQTLRPDMLSFANPADNTATGWRMASPNLSTGFWLYSEDFYLGASVDQLLGNLVIPGTWRDRQYQLPHHYFLTGAYKMSLARNLALIPSVLVKWVSPLPVSVDVNARAVYADQFWGGLSYRQADSFVFLTGVTLSHTFDVGYSYGVGISALSRSSAGSHELVLGMRLLNRHKVLCPQNLW
ncbi:type IX secretion system membrane protein PorP/SprF [soil metagenome]|jgi:type IX secretion system PorP/SprF family membrane protein